jgi:hypothetical protein
MQEGNVFRPVLQAELIEGWFAKESMTLLAPDGQANIIASSEPLDTSIDTYQYAEVQGNLLRNEFPGFVEIDYGPRLILGGKPGYLRTFSWTPDKGENVTQIQLYYAEGGRGYTATATTPTSQFARYEQQVRACLDSLKLQF